MSMLLIKISGHCTDYHKHFFFFFFFGCIGSLLWCTGFSLWWLLLLQSTGCRSAGFSSCGTWAQYLWRTGLAAPWHVGSSWTRARTRVPCIGRLIPNHCTTREAPISIFCYELCYWNISAHRHDRQIQLDLHQSPPILLALLPDRMYSPQQSLWVWD